MSRAEDYLEKAVDAMKRATASTDSRERELYLSLAIKRQRLASEAKEDAGETSAVQDEP